MFRVIPTFALVDLRFMQLVFGPLMKYDSPGINAVLHFVKLVKIRAGLKLLGQGMNNIIFCYDMIVAGFILAEYCPILFIDQTAQSFDGGIE